MLNLAEYVAASSELLTEAKRADKDIESTNMKGWTRTQVQDFAQDRYWAYYNNFHALLYRTMEEAAHNAVDHYADLLDLEPDPELVRTILSKQYDTPYHGLTLSQRMTMNHMKLSGNTYKAALIDPKDPSKHVHKMLTETFPFGNHYAIDKRLMLSTLVKIENDAARASAAKAGKLLKWNLSHTHAQKDDCDYLADHVSPDVENYVKENNLDIRSLKGVYFAEDLPQPPHPNCQCEYGIVIAREPSFKPLQRTFAKISSLLRKLRGK